MDSGGGLHIYWISDTALTPDVWKPFAWGLKAALINWGFKCDTGLTTDIARILRVPGTLNHKYDPPRLVEIVHHGRSYNFETELGFLRDVRLERAQDSEARPSPAKRAAANHTLYDPTADFMAPDPAFAGLHPSDDLQNGIEARGLFLVDPSAIFATSGCGFLHEALTTGGKDYDNPKWNMTTLCAVFMEDGDALAHRMADKHPDYTIASTQALYDRKVADRAERGIGYPGCAAIAGLGCSACGTCRHFSNGKSPLNIRPIALSSSPDVAVAVTTPVEDFANPYDEFVGPPFPFEILSPTLRTFVDVVAEASGADPSATAMAALTAISGAINAESTVQLGDGWLERPNIWTVLVGPPSSMKSPIIEKATRPLANIDRQRGKTWKTQYDLWEKEKKINRHAPLPPRLPRCLMNDATPEKVAEMLARDPRGSLMVHDEIAGFLTNFDRYNSGSSRPFYLQSWNGGSFTKDRVGNGKADVNAETFVENLALSILGGIQPDRLAQLGDLTADGLLQRFLPTLMKPAQLGDQYVRVQTAESEYDQLIRSINAEAPTAFRLERLSPPHSRCADAVSSRARARKWLLGRFARSNRKA